MDQRSIQSNLRILQKKKGFVHHRALTSHLRANRHVGRFMQTPNKTEQIAHLQGNNFTINRINYATNTKYTIFKPGYVTVQFYPTTGTLQIQGKEVSDLKTRLLDILSPNLNKRNNECTDKELDLEIYSSEDKDSVTICDLPSDLTKLENFIDSIAEIQVEQSQAATACAHEGEMAKLWKVIDLINSKSKSLEFINSKVASPAKKVSAKFNEDMALTRENESLKQKLHKAELEIQRLKEENNSLITAFRLMSINSSKVQNAYPQG